MYSEFSDVFLIFTWSVCYIVLCVSAFIEKMELIRAKVPILKFRDAQTQVDVDLNCNNAVGIRNTHLLNSYSQCRYKAVTFSCF